MIVPGKNGSVFQVFQPAPAAQAVSEQEEKQLRSSFMARMQVDRPWTLGPLGWNGACHDMSILPSGFYGGLTGLMMV